MYRHAAVAGVTVLVLSAAAGAQDSPVRGLRARLQGLVFEAKDWSSPRDAWLSNKDSPDRWNLWTQETDVWERRSMGASLRSPTIQRHQSLKDGAPPLHTVITGIPEGLYQAYLGPTTRVLGYSLDGGNWLRSAGGKETPLGLIHIADGTFELWVDDCFATPGQIGPAYYDYIRLEPTDPPHFDRTAIRRLDDDRVEVCWTSQIPLEIMRARATAGHQQLEVPIEQGLYRNHCVCLPPLEAGSMLRLAPLAKLGRSAEAPCQAIELPVPRRPEGVSAADRIELTVTEPAGLDRPAWPVSSGVPFARGALWRAEDCRLEDVTGTPCPAQFKASSRWADGSVQWLLVSFVAHTQAQQPSTYALVVDPAGSPPTQARVRVDEEGPRVRLTNGRVNFVINRERFNLLEHLTVDGEALGLRGGDGGLWMLDANGGRLVAGKPDAVEILQRGPVCAVVRVGGPLAPPDGRPLMRYSVRHDLWADEPAVRLAVSVTNDGGSDRLTPVRSASLALPLEEGRFASAWIDGQAVSASPGAPALLLQDDQEHFTLRDTGSVREGVQGQGIATWSDGRRTVSLVIRDFWQRYPRAVAVGPSGLRADLLPELPSGYHQDDQPMQKISLYYWLRDGNYLLRQGLRFTTELVVWLGDAAASPANLAQMVQQPLFAVARPEVYCRSGVFGHVLPAQPGPMDQYEEFFGLAFRGLEQTRQRRREYGWMNYGDTFGERRFNWINNEYDLIFGLLLQFARTGDLGCLWRADQQARHTADVDAIHGAAAESGRGLMYAHSVGHCGGFLLGSDPALRGIRIQESYAEGAIDPGGHMHIQGLLLMAMLSGQEDYWAAGMRVADFQAADMTTDFDFHIERAAGWPIINAVSAYEATGDPYYLNAAALMVRKVLAKQDPKDGGWLLPQDASECNCPQPHLGGKAFAVGVLLRGMVMYYRHGGDADVGRSIVRAGDWLMNCAWNPRTGGFRYKTGCPEYEDGAGIGATGALVAEGLLYASQISGDPKYRQFVLSWMDQAVDWPAEDGKNMAMQIHQLAYAADLLREQGVTTLPRSAPTTAAHEGRRRRSRAPAASAPAQTAPASAPQERPRGQSKPAMDR